MMRAPFLIPGIALLFLTVLAAHPAASSQLGHLVCDDSGRIADQLTRVSGATRQSRAMRGPDAL
ncbi:MAG: hypothetical protein P1U53_08625, partial [Sulfitobacter sp.]|nr:hypothetical protein [Sulfitobacter sp.]